jgi:ATP-dependent RNA helicase RhlE
VVNFDLPNIPETYVHRIGRTARAGAEGIAISLCAGEEMAYLRDIEKLIRVTLPKEDRRTPGKNDVGPPPSQNRGGQRNGRPAQHAQRQDGAPGNKNPRNRRRANGAGGGASQPNRDHARNESSPRQENARHESKPRPAQQGGAGAKEGSMQGVAFLHRPSRPNSTPNRSQRPR